MVRAVTEKYSEPGSPFPLNKHTPICLDISPWNCSVLYQLQSHRWHMVVRRAPLLILFTCIILHLRTQAFGEGKTQLKRYLRRRDSHN